MDAQATPGRKPELQIEGFHLVKEFPGTSETLLRRGMAGGVC